MAFVLQETSEQGKVLANHAAAAGDTVCITHSGYYKHLPSSDTLSTFMDLLCSNVDGNLFFKTPTCQTLLAGEKTLGIQGRICVRGVRQPQMNRTNCQECWGAVTWWIQAGETLRASLHLSPPSCYSSALSLNWHTAISYTPSETQNTWQGWKIHSANHSGINSKFLPGKMLFFLAHVTLLK